MAEAHEVHAPHGPEDQDEPGLQGHGRGGEAQRPVHAEPLRHKGEQEHHGGLHPRADEQGRAQLPGVPAYGEDHVVEVPVQIPVLEEHQHRAQEHPEEGGIGLEHGSVVRPGPGLGGFARPLNEQQGTDQNARRAQQIQGQQPVEVHLGQGGVGLGDQGEGQGSHAPGGGVVQLLPPVDALEAHGVGEGLDGHGHDGHDHEQAHEDRPALGQEQQPARQEADEAQEEQHVPQGEPARLLHPPGQQRLQDHGRGTVQRQDQPNLPGAEPQPVQEQAGVAVDEAGAHPV